MVRNTIPVLFFLGCSFWLKAQQLQFNVAEKLPATINTRSEEGMPLLSPDGQKLFFTRSLYRANEGGLYGGQDIWISERIATGWKRATNTLTFNNKNNNVVSGISKDGSTLYFVNASPFQKMEGIYTSRLAGNTWLRPQLLAIPGIENLDFISFFVSPDLDVMFLSMKAPDSRGNEDLYFTVKDKSGMWTKPKNLGSTINTSGYEISPFLSADKNRLYFSSNGHGGEGDADIFYSERLYGSWETWSVPVNLGKGVNSKKFDAYFSIYGDTVAYFASNRDDKYADIFRVKVSEQKTILRRGERYLTGGEWDELVGKNVSAEFLFAHQSTHLTAAQEELIFFIVNKLMLQKDIRFHLVVREEEDPELSTERMKLIHDQLLRSGIDKRRINDEQVFDIEKTQRGVIEIMLYR